MNANAAPLAGDQEQGPPEWWGRFAQLSACAVARDHPERWAATHRPDAFAGLDVPLETIWAAIRLAASGADLTTPLRT